MIELKKAQRKNAKLRLGMASPSGGGKTIGALLIAYGLMKETYPKLSDAELWAKIAIIDTESGSGQLYVNKEIGNLKIGEYNAITLSAPFEVEKYIQSIDVCEEAGIEVGILDSTTHAWAGTGGLLEQQNNTAKRTGNSWTAWRDITPQHSKLVEKMLQSNMHIIATMRSKTEYVQEKGTDGKTVVRKVGMNPIQKDGMEYEFTTFFDIDAEHNAFGSKDRTSLFDQKYFVITPNTGRELMKWLQGGTSEPDKVVAVSKASPAEAKAKLQGEIIEKCKSLGGAGNESLMTLLKTFEPSGNPNKIADVSKLKELLEKLGEFKVEGE